MEKLYFLPLRNLTIKNIIFDLGGVILNIDYQLTLDEFKKLGLQNFDNVFTKAKQIGIFDLFDKGLISPEDFRNEIRSLAGVYLSDEQIYKAWNALLLDFPIQRLKLLEQLREQYKTYLLSNTNHIHCEVYNNTLEGIWNGHNLSYFFEKVYYSHKIHHRKPDQEAFELIIKENSLNPAETLFIDDTEHHIEGARKVGLQTHFLNLKKGETIEDLFKTY